MEIKVDLCPFYSGEQVTPDELVEIMVLYPSLQPQAFALLLQHQSQGPQLKHLRAIVKSKATDSIKRQAQQVLLEMPGVSITDLMNIIISNKELAMVAWEKLLTKEPQANHLIQLVLASKVVRELAWAKFLEQKLGLWALRQIFTPSNILYLPKDCLAKIMELMLEQDDLTQGEIERLMAELRYLHSKNKIQLRQKAEAKLQKTKEDNNKKLAAGECVTFDCRTTNCTGRSLLWSGQPFSLRKS